MAMPATNPSKRPGSPRALTALGGAGQRDWGRRGMGGTTAGSSERTGLVRPELGWSEGSFVVETIGGGVGKLVGLSSGLDVAVEGAVGAGIGPEVGDSGGNAEAEGGCGFGVSKGDVDGGLGRFHWSIPRWRRCP